MALVAPTILGVEDAPVELTIVWSNGIDSKGSGDAIVGVIFVVAEVVVAVFLGRPGPVLMNPWESNGSFPSMMSVERLVTVVVVETASTAGIFENHSFSSAELIDLSLYFEQKAREVFC